MWWGHRIPAYECRSKSSNKSVWVAAQDIEQARRKAADKFSESYNEVDVLQDNDVLDTWFSSALLPFSSFGWPENVRFFIVF